MVNKPKAKAGTKLNDNKTLTVKEEKGSRVQGILRVILVGASSIMAERAWQNRETLTKHLYHSKQTPTEQTMISIFAYFALMGLIFLGGFVLSKFTTFIGRYLK